MFDARRFLHDHFQSAEGVIAFCRAADVDPPNSAQAQKWFERNSIPGDWLARLLALVEQDRGAPVELAPYTTGEQAP